MKRPSTWIAVVALMCFATSSGAQSPPDSVGRRPARLSSEYPIVAGEMAAIVMMSNLPAARVEAQGIDAVITCSYDRLAGKVVVSIYGDQSTRYFGALRPLERAEAALEYFRTRLFPLLKIRAASAQEICPRESELRLVYFNTFGGIREVVRWDDGKYSVAK